MGALTITPEQRAEAHLWLLLEEALVAVGRGGADPWEVQRHFRSVADAVALAGVIDAGVAGSLKIELDDALVVRGLVPPASFLGRPAHTAEAGTAATPRPGKAAVTHAAEVWLEAEVERHLDLLAGYDPTVRPDAGADAMRILGGPVRAFDAAGILGQGRATIADFATSIAAAGFDLGRTVAGDGRVRREWVRFLRDRPAPVPHPHEADHVSTPRTVLGVIHERSARVDEVAWSADGLDLSLSLRQAVPDDDDAEDDGSGRHLTFGVSEAIPWYARAADDRGRLHLGQPRAPVLAGGTGVRFTLRPGLDPGIKRLHVRVSSRGAKVEGTVTL